MLRTVKPRNARSKRALEKREPKAIENPKKTLFLRGTSASELVQTALNDIHSLKKPFTLKFTKKNAIHPFEDSTPLEFFSQKNDTSLVLFASHSKKRPHNLTFLRTFSHRTLDIFEFSLDPNTFLPLSAFKNQKPAIGMKPMLLFCGAPWDSNPRFQALKSLFMDFFKGPTVDRVDVEGLQYIIQLSAPEIPAQTEAAGQAGPALKIHIRAYLVRSLHSGQKLPRIELEEMGPRMDLTLGRVREPEDEMWKEAMKKAKKVELRTKKNVTMDIMGDKLGRIHTGKQDLSKLQSRKMKGLKRGKEDDETVVGEEEGPVEKVKRARRE
ncbi:Brix domain-containing protein [Tirmania nivea]|nr:Brix domain-containing protein [Tirmania nivea]